MPEVLDVVVDGVQTVMTSLDQEVVEPHVERTRSSGTSQAARAHFVDDEQQPCAFGQLVTRLSGQRSRNLEGDPISPVPPMMTSFMIMSLHEFL